MYELVQELAAIECLLQLLYMDTNILCNVYASYSLPVKLCPTYEARCKRYFVGGEAGVACNCTATATAPSKQHFPALAPAQPGLQHFVFLAKFIV